jgi:hypothetical protein
VDGDRYSETAVSSIERAGSAAGTEGPTSRRPFFFVSQARRLRPLVEPSDNIAFCRARFDVEKKRGPVSIGVVVVRRLHENGFRPQHWRKPMRVMVIVKANEDSEAAKLPDESMLSAMGKFNEELVNAGIMLAGEGLHPSSKGKRIYFTGKSRTVVDGPFTESKELIAGFWLWQVKSIDEAVEWVKRMPAPHAEMPESTNVEIRQVFEMPDFGELSPEVVEREARLRAKIQEKKG